MSNYWEKTSLCTLALRIVNCVIEMHALLRSIIIGLTWFSVGYDFGNRSWDLEIFQWKKTICFFFFFDIFPRCRGMMASWEQWSLLCVLPILSQLYVDASPAEIVSVASNGVFLLVLYWICKQKSTPPPCTVGIRSNCKKHETTMIGIVFIYHVQNKQHIDNVIRLYYNTHYLIVQV